MHIEGILHDIHMHIEGILHDIHMHIEGILHDIHMHIEVILHDIHMHIEVIPMGFCGLRDIANILAYLGTELFHTSIQSGPYRVPFEAPLYFRFSQRLNLCLLYRVIDAIHTCF